jgi:membrane protein
MSRPNGELSTGELLAQLTNQVTRLVRNEVTLAQHEVRGKLEKSAPGVRLLGIGLGLALLAGAALVACVVLLLALFVPPWLSALIVGVVVLIIALIFVSAGRSRLRKAGPPVPTEAMASIQESVKVLAEGVRR